MCFEGKGQVVLSTNNFSAALYVSLQFRFVVLHRGSHQRADWHTAQLPSLE